MVSSCKTYFIKPVSIILENGAPMALESSLDAYLHLPGAMTICSHRAGWHSLLLRGYDDPTKVEEFVTPSTDDHLIVLVTKGACEIEVKYRQGWQRNYQRAGHIGMTAPGESAVLRWNGSSPHSTLQLHLPATTLKRVHDELDHGTTTSRGLPSKLAINDPLVRQLMLSLSSSLRAGFPDLYAETASELLAVHLLRGRDLGKPFREYDERRLKLVDEYLRENFGSALTLQMLATEAGVSRFHLLRLFKRAFGESPLKRLTRYRMDEAALLVCDSKENITNISAICGYDNPSHFATAFRRYHGVSPSVYRKQKLMPASRSGP
jgi:AraC family transcriptional regulator